MSAFGRSFSGEAVLEARLRVKANNLAAVVEKRKTCLFNLENALELKSKGKSGANVQQFAHELKELNKDVADRISAIEAARAERENTRRRTFPSAENPPAFVDLEDTNHDESHTDYHSVQDHSSAHSTVTGSIKAVTNFGNKIAKTAVTESLKQAGNVLNTAALLVNGQEDGGVYSAGFLTFKTLSTTNAALQMVHNPTPFSMKVLPAPDPDDGTLLRIGRVTNDEM